MDDIPVLARSRWKLRKAVRIVNRMLNGLQLEKHPRKTFIGKMERGFDFLGYSFRPGRLAVAQKTVDSFVSRAVRPYEQEPGLVYRQLHWRVSTALVGVFKDGGCSLVR
jgi:RNA-directed DNA polymerase